MGNVSVGHVTLEADLRVNFWKESKVPEKETVEKAQKAKRAGKAPTTQECRIRTAAFAVRSKAIGTTSKRRPRRASSRGPCGGIYIRPFRTGAFCSAKTRGRIFESSSAQSRTHKRTGRSGRRCAQSRAYSRPQEINPNYFKRSGKHFVSRRTVFRSIS